MGNVRPLRQQSAEPAAVQDPVLRALAVEMIAEIQRRREADGHAPYRQSAVDAVLVSALRAANEWRTRMNPLTALERQSFYKFAGAWLAERLAFEFCLVGEP